MASTVSMIKNGLPALLDRLNGLTRKDVLVGVPQENDARKGTDEMVMNNATLAFIHDRGSPAANIPARPFMQPGITRVKNRLINEMHDAAATVLQGGEDTVAFDNAGLIAQRSIRAVINDGPPPPLEDSTIAARKRRGRLSEKPLVDTGQLRNSITYVVRDKNNGPA